ncbi:MAG: YbhB/YbcL family Raf kinase inhibitor-like protein [Actinobacteria bacterium]|nr:YbhB/YbcL family Raf kinase inhibitor-like protein [Actinomycetota bacterium]
MITKTNQLANQLAKFAVRKLALSRGAILLLCLTTVAITACSTDGRDLRAPGAGQGESIEIVETTAETTPATQDSSLQAIFTVSGTWLDGGAIDSRHTCSGANISPSLEISNTSIDAKSLAITLIDLAAPEKPLWVMANISPDETSIQEGGIPAEAIVGATTNGTKINFGYSGPCATGNEMHEYLLVVYALDQMLEFEPDPKSLNDSRLLYEAIQASAFDSAETRFFAQTP